MRRTSRLDLKKAVQAHNKAAGFPIVTYSEGTLAAERELERMETRLAELRVKDPTSPEVEQLEVDRAVAAREYRIRLTLDEQAAKGI